jgi:hypothetical protein
MTARLTALLCATALVGFVVGARAVSAPVPEQLPERSAGVREVDPLHGSFWRPAGSEAARPASSLAPRSWVPRDSDALATQPDPLRSVRALVRLALPE